MVSQGAHLCLDKQAVVLASSSILHMHSIAGYRPLLLIGCQLSQLHSQEVDQ